MSVRKLSEEQRREVILQIAQYAVTPSGAVRYIKKHFGVTISQPAILYYIRNPKWAKFFDYERGRYLQKVNDVAGANQRVRLERQEEIYLNSRKRRNYRMALEATREQRNEMDPKHSSFGDTYNFNTQNNQFNSMSDEEFKVKKMEIAKRIKELEMKGETNGSSRTAGENTQ